MAEDVDMGKRYEYAGWLLSILGNDMIPTKLLVLAYLFNFCKSPLSSLCGNPLCGPMINEVCNFKSTKVLVNYI